MPAGRRTGIQRRLQLGDLDRGQLAPGAACPDGGQHGPAAIGQGTPPPVR